MFVGVRKHTKRQPSELPRERALVMRFAGESACATTGQSFGMVGEALSPANAASGRIFHSQLLGVAARIGIAARQSEPQLWGVVA